MSAHALDWPLTLRLSAAIRPLATALYVAHCRTDGSHPIPYATLPTSIKRFYDGLAVTTLRRLTTPPGYFEVAVEQAKAARDKLIGRITPTEPYGADPRD